MTKVLNQEEIDAMVRAARGAAGESNSPAKTATVTPWDARQSGQIGREQVRFISQMHEGFARSLTDSLGAYLRIKFSAALVSAEHLAYRDFLERVPDITYLASCRLAPAGVSGLFQMDLAVAFPLVDILLGGLGTGNAPNREITEIEEQILETVMRMVCRELEAAWQPLGLQFQFEQHQTADVAQHLMSEEEKILSLCFEITLAEGRGSLNLAIPASVSNALLRKITADLSTRRGQREASRLLPARLLECPFPVELGAHRVTVPVHDLLRLVPGGLLVMKRAVAKPATLLVGELPMFAARAARKGSARVAQVLTPLADSAKERKQPR